MKRTLIYLLLVLFLAYNLYSETNKIDYKEINQLKVYFISFDVTTVVDVGCEESQPMRDLISMFEGVILKKKMIKDITIINRLISDINSCSFSKSDETPNIRIKIEFYKNNKRKHILCIGKYQMFFDGKTIEFSQKINNYVLQIIDYYKFFPKQKF